MIVAITRDMAGSNKITSFVCIPKEQVTTYDRNVPNVIFIDMSEVPKQFYAKPSDYILDENDKIVYNFNRKK